MQLSCKFQGVNRGQKMRKMRMRGGAGLLIFFSQRYSYPHPHISIHIQDYCPHFRFSCHDTAYITPASWIHSTSEYYHLDGERYGQQLQPLQTVRPLCTSRTVDSSEDTLCLPSATYCRSHALQRRDVRDGGTCAGHSSGCQLGSDSRDDCTVVWIYGAWFTSMWA